METNSQRLIHTFSALADLGQEIASAGDFEEMLRTSFHLLLGSLAIRRGAVAEFDRDRGQLHLLTTRGLGQLENIDLPIASDQARQLASFGSTLTLADAKAEAARLMEEHAQSFASAEIDLLIPLIVRERDNLCSRRYLIPFQPIGITIPIDTLMVVAGHQWNVGIRVRNRRQDFIARGRMPAHLLRFLCVETVRRIDYAQIDNQLSNVVQITRNGNSFNFIIAPAHFTRNDFTVFADAH